MKNKEQFEELVTSGDETAVELAQCIYSELIFSDVHLNIALRIEKLANQFGINVHTDKQIIGNLNNQAKKLNKSMMKNLGDDNIAEQFGDRADLIQDTLYMLVFMSEENLIKINSQSKLLWKAKANN